MAVYSLDDVLTPSKQTYALEDVVPAQPKAVAPWHQRAMYGVREPVNAAAQMAYNAMPEAVQQAGDKADAWLYEKTGGFVGSLPGSFNQDLARGEREYQKTAPEGIDWARIGGNVVPSLLLTRGVPATSTFRGSLAANTTAGAGIGSLAPVYKDDGEFWKSKGKQAAGGGGAGAVMTPATHMLGRLIAPKAARNPDLKKLTESGVKPTFGQSLGGWANATEEKLQSMPFVGDAIAAARGRSRQEFNKAALDRVVEPIGKKATKVGTEGVAQVQKMVDDAYTVAKGKVAGVVLDTKAKGDIAALRALAKNLTPSQRRQFENVYTSQVKARLSKAGGMTADSWKRASSYLGEKAARYKKGNASEQELGDALAELDNILMGAAKRQSPEFAKAITKADAAYSNLVRVELAGQKAAGAADETFTPGQLMQAVRQADPTKRKRGTAGGRANMQDLAGAGQRVLGNKVPDSGTASRGLVNVGGLLAGSIEPTVALALAGGVGAYTPFIQNLLRGAATMRPQQAQALAQALRPTAPAFALPAAGLLGAQN